VPGVLDRSVADEIILVNENESMANALALARKRGFSLGFHLVQPLRPRSRLLPKHLLGPSFLPCCRIPANAHLSTPLFAASTRGPTMNGWHPSSHERNGQREVEKQATITSMIMVLRVLVLHGPLRFDRL